MSFEITPQPSDQERAAIEAALEQEADERRSSPWADRLLPQREDEPWDSDPGEGPPFVTLP